MVSGRASKLHVEVACGPNHVRRSGRKQTTTSTKMEDPITFAPLSIEKSVDNKSPLNPLAARAVLASLVSKHPQKIEFVRSEGTKCVPVFDYTVQQSASLEIVGGVLMSGGSDSGTFNYAVTASAESLDNEKAQKSNIEGVRLTKFHAQKTCGRQVVVDGCKNEDLTETCGSMSSSMREEESAQPLRGSRLTRPAAKTQGVTSNGEVESRMGNEGIMFGRVTRSAFKRGSANLSVEVKEALQDNPVRVTQLTDTSINRESRPLNGEDRSTIDVQAKYKASLTNTKRITRSTARKVGVSLDDKVKEALEGEPQTESAVEGICMADDCVLTRNRVSQMVNAEHELVESNKKQKRLAAVEKSQKTAGFCLNFMRLGFYSYFLFLLLIMVPAFSMYALEIVFPVGIAFFPTACCLETRGSSILTSHLLGIAFLMFVFRPREFHTWPPRGGGWGSLKHAF